MNFKKQFYRIYIFLSKYFFSLFASIYTHSIGILNVKHRNVIYRMCDFYKFYVEKPKIPVRPFKSIFKKDPIVSIGDVDKADGNVTLAELVALCKAARVVSPKYVFEFGTYDGRTTLNISYNTKAAAKIATIDLDKAVFPQTALPLTPGEDGFFSENKTGHRFLSKKVSAQFRKKIKQYYGDTAEFNFKKFYGKCDFIFVDASHSYEYVKNDSNIAFKLLTKKRGIILWHDYTSWEGVTRALNEIFLENKTGQMYHIQGTTIVVYIAPNGNI